MVDISENHVRSESSFERPLWIMMAGLSVAQLAVGSFAAGFGWATMRQEPSVVTLYEKVASPAFATNLSVDDQNVTCPVILKLTPERTTAVVPRYCLDTLKR